MAVGLHVWERDSRLYALKEILTETPRPFQVISFDFFDTLVSRLTPDPSSLFIEVGRRLASNKLLRMPVSPTEFHYTRIAAEEQARKSAVAQGRSAEVTIADIYEKLAPVVTNCESALQVEKETEQDLCYVNPNMASLVQYVRSLGYRTAIVSDTYLSSRDLEGILLMNGMNPALFDRIIVSSEAGSSKWDNGGLYLTVLRQFDVYGSEMLHIGDNYSCDIELSAKYGIVGLYYHQATPYQQGILQAEEAFERSSAPVGASLKTLRVLTARQHNSADECFMDGAFVYGPVLSRFADWSLEIFSKAGVRTVLALMREGELLGEMLFRSAAAHHMELNVLPCYVSRKATAHAALSQGISHEKVRELLVGGPLLSIRDALSIIGLGKEAEQFIAPSTLSRKIKTEEMLDSVVRMVVEGSTMRSLVAASAAEKQDLAFDYLTGLIGDSEGIGVLDLGWSGSIQRNISNILRAGGRQVKTVGCYLATTRRAARLALQGDEAHGFLGGDWSGGSTLVLEVPILASVGSTDGYVRDEEGNAVPVLGPHEPDDNELRLKRRLREGILAFQANWLGVKCAKGERVFSESILAEIDRRNVPIIRRLTEYPTQQEALRIGSMRHDENYGVAYSRSLCNPEAEEAFRARGVSGLFQQEGCYWPQAVVAREAPKLISALSYGWALPEALGRSGARASFEGKPSSLTEEECRFLTDSLWDRQVRQVVFFGPGLEGDAAFLRSLPVNGGAPEADRRGDSCKGNGMRIGHARGDGPAVPGRQPQGNGARPSIIEIRTGVPKGPESRPAFGYVQLSAPAEELDALRKVRDLIVPQSRCLLILTEGMQGDAVMSVLLFLSSFLGEGSMLAGNHGRLDRVSLYSQSNIKSYMGRWFLDHGRPNGYRLLEPGPGDGDLELSWTCFVKGSHGNGTGVPSKL